MFPSYRSTTVEFLAVKLKLNRLKPLDTDRRTVFSCVSSSSSPFSVLHFDLLVHSNTPSNDISNPSWRYQSKECPQCLCLDSNNVYCQILKSYHFQGIYSFIFRTRLRSQHESHNLRCPPFQSRKEPWFCWTTRSEQNLTLLLIRWSFSSRRYVDRSRRNLHILSCSSTPPSSIHIPLSTSHNLLHSTPHRPFRCIGTFSSVHLLTYPIPQHTMHTLVATVTIRRHPPPSSSFLRYPLCVGRWFWSRLNKYQHMWSNVLITWWDEFL